MSKEDLITRTAPPRMGAHERERQRVAASLLLLDERDKPTRRRWA
jgi:hypothetical protein